jgi:hypothetical protein
VRIDHETNLGSILRNDMVDLVVEPHNPSRVNSIETNHPTVTLVYPYNAGQVGPSFRHATESSVQANGILNTRLPSAGPLLTAATVLEDHRSRTFNRSKLEER